MAKARALRSFDWDWDGGEHWGEPALARRRRLDERSKDGKRAEAIDRSGSASHLEHSVKRLKAAGAEDRVLYVQQWNMDKAVAAMKRAGVSGIVSNLSDSQHRRVKARRS